MTHTRGMRAESSAASEGRRKRRRVDGQGEEVEGFDQLRFRSPSHQTTAYKRTQRVLTMSRVAPAFLAFDQLRSVFEFQQITRILDIGEDVFEESVRDFYTNLIWDEGQQALKGLLRGRDFLVQATDMHEIISVFHPDTPGLYRPCSAYRAFIQEWRDRHRERPQDEDDVEMPRPPTDQKISMVLTGSDRFDPANINQTNMLAPMHIRLLVKIIRLILVPKGGDKAILTDLVKVIMICLLFRRPLDLSRLIMGMMRDCAQQERRALGYGKIITVLLRGNQFDFSPYHPMALEAAIDDEKVIVMTKGGGPGGIGFRFESEHRRRRRIRGRGLRRGQLRRHKGLV